MKPKHSYMIIILVCIFLSIVDTNAATITATNCSQSAVQSAINTASNNDSVTVPAGNCSWTTPITLNKSIALLGSGKSSTFISGQGFIVSDGTNDWRISGFSFKDSGGITYGIEAGDKVRSTVGVKNFRIDNNLFNGYGHSIEVNGNSYGVIDHNEFTLASGSFIWVYGDDEAAWTRATNLGGSDWIFIEDNIFTTGNATSSHFILGNWGGKYVVRYNILEETGTGWRSGWIDAHGYCHGTNVRGTRAFEIYGNTFIRNGNTTCCRALNLRGGTGVVFANRFNETKAKFMDGSLHEIVHLVEYRASMFAGTSEVCNSSCSTSGWGMSQSEDPQRYCINQTSPYTDTGKPCSSDSDCSGGAICSPYGEGYPICDQIGTGQNQKLEPLYFWDNKDHNNLASPIVVSKGSTKYIQENRDFYRENMSYNQTTNTWNNTKTGFIYKPYTYPHPLVGSTSSQPPTLPPPISTPSGFIKANE